MKAELTNEVPTTMTSYTVTQNGEVSNVSEQSPDSAIPAFTFAGLTAIASLFFILNI